MEPSGGKHIRLKEPCAEGETSHEAKIDTGPILLTCSFPFPYLRDWLKEHLFTNAIQTVWHLRHMELGFDMAVKNPGAELIAAE